MPNINKATKGNLLLKTTKFSGNWTGATGCLFKENNW